MAWGKTDAKELLGMEPEELSNKLGKIDSIDNRFAEAQTRTDERFNQLFAKIDELKPKAPPKPDIDPDLAFLERPTESLDERLAPYQQQSQDTRIMLEHRNARERFPNDFDRWGNEIVAVMNDAAPGQRVNPSSWEMAVMVVRGRHAGEIEKDGATDNFRYLEPVSAGLRPDPKATGNMTQGERLMVKKLNNASPFGMTEEKYSKGKARLDKARSARLGEFASVDHA